ncbi:MAG: response regulator [Rhodospirillales bacterium]|nr:response regulator [Rhodospirillales bacterium]
MPDRAMKVLVVQAAGNGEPLPVASIDGHGLAVDSVERFAAPADALDRLDGDDIDLVLLDIGARGADALATIGDVRQRAPTVPIIIITDGRDDAVALAALRSGAQDCLVRSEMEEHRPLLARAVRFAIERGFYLSDLDRNHQEGIRDRDVEALQAIFAGAKLSVTERSLGQSSVRERHPADFRKLIIDYGRILDDVVAAATATPRRGENHETTMALSAIADRLGLLGAGPRDVVELHKGVLAPRVEGRDSRAARRALDYIEEGKLLVLQLMGQLVLFYRSLSWGRPLPSASLSGRPMPPAAPTLGDR